MKEFPEETTERGVTYYILSTGRKFYPGPCGVVRIQAEPESCDWEFTVEERLEIARYAVDVWLSWAAGEENT